MELTPESKIWLKSVRESLTPKPGLLGKLFGKNQEEVDDPSLILSGLRLDNYEFGKLLGVGGVGAVFSCKEIQQSQSVDLAIKVLGRAENEPASEAALFERELEIGQKLSHPAIVRTLDGKHNDIARFLIMERVDGKNLTEELGQPWPASRILEVFRVVADGLQHAHDHNVVHRDLKPDNIMLTRQGEVKILDFGMAQLKGAVEVTVTGQFKGTPMYTSPEQIQDTKKIPATCDQFTFGMILFEALSGQLPYPVDPKDPMAAIFARLTQAAAPLRSVLPSASEELESVMAKMLSPDPKNRYPSIAEAFNAVASALG